jgi:hypothetical protein
MVLFVYSKAGAGLRAIQTRRFGGEVRRAEAVIGPCIQGKGWGNTIDLHPSLIHKENMFFKVIDYLFSYN